MNSELNALIDTANECADRLKAILDRMEARQSEPFRLEVGKRYLTRDGLKTGPLKKTGSISYQFGAVVAGSIYMTWTESGGFCGDEANHNDLVSELIEPEPKPTTRYYRGTTPITSDMIWRVSPSGIDCRMAHQSEWMDSICDISSVLHETREISANEGEIHNLADSITTAFLSELESLLVKSCMSIWKTRRDAESGEISTEQAASVVKQVAKSITEFCA